MWNIAVHIYCMRVKKMNGKKESLDEGPKFQNILFRVTVNVLLCSNQQRALVVK